MSLVTVSTPFNISLEFEVAPFVRRLLAWSLDFVVMLVFAQGMKYLLSEVVFEYTTYSAGVDFLVVSLPLLFYHLAMELAFNGRSLGKMALAMRVMSLDGGEPRLGQYLMRWVFRFWEWPLVFSTVALGSLTIYLQVFLVLIFGLGVVVTIAVSARSQRLGDLAAGTTVVDLRSRFGIDDTIFKDITPDTYQVKHPEVMRLNDRDINAIQGVIKHARKTGRLDTAQRVTARIQEILQIPGYQEPVEFLEQLLNDYNYLATKN